VTKRGITVLGGSGFLGRAVVRRLRAEGAPVRVATRRPPETAERDIEPVRADVRDEASVARAIEGSHGVVNTVALYVERATMSVERTAPLAEVTEGGAPYFSMVLVHRRGVAWR